MVLIEGFLVLETTKTFLDFLHGKPLLLKLLVSHLELHLVLAKLLLKTVYQFLECICITLGTFEDGYVGFESLVNFLSCAKF